MRGMERDTADQREQTEKFVKLIKQLDEQQKRALLLLIKSTKVLAGVEKDLLL